nr:DUF930 domain-containing protein [uncultured Cohaesibacter sp.]
MAKKLLLPIGLLLSLAATSANAASLSGKAVATIEEMMPDEQLVQRCDMETLEKLDAERVLPYAFEPLKYGDHKIIAKGAAYRRGGKWYRLQFECTTSPDHLTVEAFRFTKGEIVPRDEWDSYNLFP